MEIDRPEDVSQTDLNVKQLRNRNIPMSPPKIPPRSSQYPKIKCQEKMRLLI